VIHLDSNYLILGTQPGTQEDAHFQMWLGRGEAIATSSIAWMEFVTGPVLPTAVGSILQTLSGGVMPVGRREAEMAAALFNATGRKRTMRYDCLIAASAILADAELATNNIGDFLPFTPHGLRLFQP
jgi:predicted nucleic acid-binding protein